MRVFIAIEFDTKTKRKISTIKDEIAQYSKSGNYTLFDNLHMTLKFIGEIEENNIKKLQKAMENTVKSFKPFSFALDNIGRFVRQRKSLIWLGIKDGEDKLSQLHQSLDKNLNIYGFPKDQREFTPHVTIGRKIDLTLPFNQLKRKISIDPIPIYVDRLTLMESKRVDGKLVYLPIYRATFNT